MKAPKYERAEMFHATVQAAVDFFNCPIDSIEISGTLATVRASGAVVVFDLFHEGGRDGAGRILLGGGNWVACARSADAAAP